MTDHLDNDKNLKCGHKAIDWDGNGNCITCARDLVLGVDNDKEEQVKALLLDLAKYTRLASMKANEKITAFYQLNNNANVDLTDMIPAIANRIDNLYRDDTQSKLKAFAGEVEKAVGEDIPDPRNEYSQHHCYNNAKAEVRQSLKAIKEKYQL